MIVLCAYGAIAFAGNVLGGRTPAFVAAFNLAALAVGFGLRLFIRRGNTRLLGLVAVVFSLASITVTVAALGTVRIPTAALYAVVVITAGLIYDWPGILVSVAAGSLAIGGLAVAENAGWLPKPDYAVTITQWIVYTLLFAFCGGLVYWAVQALGEALRRADRAAAELKQMNQALQESEQFYRAIFEQAAVGVAVVSPPGDFAAVNQKFCDFLGYSREELMRLNVVAITHPQDVPVTTTVLKNEGGRATPGDAVEKRYLRKDGRVVWGSVTVSPLGPDGGAGRRHVAVVQDITARKEMEVALKASEEKYRTLIETMNTGIFMTSAEGRFLQANSALAQMGGYESVEALMQQTADVLYANPAEREGTLAELRAHGFVKDREVRVVKRDGTPFWLAVSMVLLKNVAGHPVVVLGAATDLTERKRAEAAMRQLNAALEQRVAARTAELQQANAELVRANRLKDEFLANMSHELRTPLTAILGLSESLQTGVYGDMPERQRNIVGLVYQSGDHLLALINDILDLAKIGAGRVDLVLAPVSVYEICQAGLELVRPRAESKDLQLSLTLDPTVPELRADVRRLKQMLANLLSNAVKFTPEDGRVDLAVIAVPEQREVCFRIRDTGIGVAPEKQGLLFQPFVQIDGGLNRQFAGSGLGLVLTRRLAELHGGRVTAESAGLGKGSTFTIYLPWPAERP